MKSAVEYLNPTRAKLTVDVSVEELQPGLDKAYKTIGQQVQVPGFRKGKVPTRIIDQRIGRAAVIQQAINDNIDSYYQNAIEENKLRPLSQPEVEITAAPDEKTLEGDLTFVVQVDVRPTLELPAYDALELEVDAAEVTDEDIQTELDQLRERFATTRAVDRPAQEGDQLVINLTATVDGDQVDDANSVPYVIGAKTLLDGLDEALDGLSEGEDAIFDTTLKAGPHQGKEAQVKVVVESIKERELPEIDDEFAQVASEFDTVEELKEDLRSKAADKKVVEQGNQAREKLLEHIRESIEVPVPETLLNEQVENHFQGPTQESDHDTAEHREEVRGDTEKAIKTQFILDQLADEQEIEVGQGDLIQYIVSAAGQYGMNPNELAGLLEQNGQLPSIVSELARNKVIVGLLRNASVKDASGTEIDLTAFLGPEAEEETETSEAEAEAEEAGAEAVAVANEEAASTPAVVEDEQSEAEDSEAETTEPTAEVTAPAKKAKPKTSKTAAKKPAADKE